MTTEDWRRRPPLPAEAAGLEVAMAADIASEALRIALRLRQALENPGKRAVLITPSRAWGGGSRPSCCAGASASTTAPACRWTSRRRARSCC